MFFGWAILSPISRYYGWAPGNAGDMSTGARGWILWVALAIMTADSLISLLPIIGESFSQMSQAVHKTDQNHVGQRAESGEVEPPSRLVPESWSLFGLLFSITSGTVIIWSLFGSEGIKPWAIFIGFTLGGGVSLLG